MPVELLSFPPSYCVVGAYRLASQTSPPQTTSPLAHAHLPSSPQVHDPTLWRPIWLHSRTTLKRCLLAAAPFALCSFPLTRLYVQFVLSRSPFSPKNIHDAAYLGVSVVQYTTAVLVLGQVSALLEWALRREIRKAKKVVYADTVRSRGKPDDFWVAYVEEWKVPPLERAQRSAEKQAWLTRLASPWTRMFALKVLLTPVAWVPGLSIVVSALLQSLTSARVMHKPYFEAKKMTPLQVELFVTERLEEYRMFGFVAAVLERIPILGLVLSISNRIGAAMWAFDLEKRQHAFADGSLKPDKVYLSKTAAFAAQGPPDLPESFAGGFPTTKGPIRIEADGTEVGRPGVGRSSAVAAPALPPRPAKAEL